MGEDKISYQLTGFEKLEIIRTEIGDLTEALQETEGKLRAVHYEVERLRFLAGLAKSYTKSEAPDGYAELKELEANRVEIVEKLAALKAALPKAEAEATGGAPAGTAAPQAPRAPRAPGASGGSQKRKGFDSFEDFRSRKQ